MLLTPSLGRPTTSSLLHRHRRACSRHTHINDKRTKNKQTKMSGHTCICKQNQNLSLQVCLTSSQGGTDTARTGPKVSWYLGLCQWPVCLSLGEVQQMLSICKGLLE